VTGGPTPTLRPVRSSDLDFVLGLLTEPGVRRYLMDDKVASREDIAGLMPRWIAGLAWIIEMPQPVGLVSVGPVHPALVELAPALTDEWEITIALSERAWGRGVAAIACRQALAQAFASSRRPSILGIVDAPNRRSHALMTRLGFKPEGHMAGIVHELQLYRVARPIGPS